MMLSSVLLQVAAACRLFAPVMCLPFTLFRGAGWGQAKSASEGRGVRVVVGRLDWPEGCWAISLAGPSDSHQRISSLWAHLKNTRKRPVSVARRSLCVEDSSLDFSGTLVVMSCFFEVPCEHSWPD